MDDFSPLQLFVDDVAVIDGRVRPFLDAFTNFRKAIISFMFVRLCLSVRMEHPGSHCTELSGSYRLFIANLSRKLKFR